ncbi:MAG: tetratricopeptide repeat protein [Thermoproteota archaeon]
MRYEEAVKIIDLINEGKIDDALKIADDAEALIDIGVSFWLKGAYEITLKIFDRATQLKPNYVEAWYNKGLALHRLGRIEEALRCYDEAIMIKPNYAEAWSSKGAVLYSLGRIEEALKCYDEAIMIKPNYAEVRALREEVRTLRDLQTKREKWRKEGYNVSGLEKLKMEDIDHVRNVLERFEQIVQRISTLEREANVLGLEKIEAEVSSLKGRLGDLDKIEEIGEYVSQLQKRTSELAIGKLEKLKEELKSFNISDLGFEVFTIEKRLKEGRDIDKIIGEISTLRAKMEERIKVEMEKWIDETSSKVRRHVKTLEQST